MKILIDNADIQEIKEAYGYFPITGVTCNPIVLKKTGRNPYDVLKKVHEFIGADGDLHVQVVNTKAEDMVVEAHKVQEMLGKNTYIKIPIVREGLKTMKPLCAGGANITGTAIYNQMQGYLAGMAGTAYVAPYVNHIDNLGYSGVQVAKDIYDMLKHAGLRTEVIAVSFKNLQQVLELARYGLGTSAIAPDVVEGLIKADATVLAVDAFTGDFGELCGEGNTTLNI